MSDLVAFLRARLDEDSQTANAAIEGPWIQPAHTPTEVRTYDGGGTIATHVLPRNAEHIARHDPARVLREVEVKRMLIDELIEGVDKAFGEGSIDHNLRYRGPSTSIDEETGELEEIPEWNVTRQLRLFALPYGAHPDYREEWRP